MSESQKIIISIPRNAAILVVAALVLGIFYYFGVYEKPPAPEDIVKVIVDDRLRSVLEGCKSNLQSFGVTYPAFVDNAGNLRVTSIGDDAPVDLCGPGPEADESGQRSCKLVTSSAQLVSALSSLSNSDRGSCQDLLGNARLCHKSTEKYGFHSSGRHYPCRYNNCP